MAARGKEPVSQGKNLHTKCARVTSLQPFRLVAVFWWWLVVFRWCVGGGDVVCCDVM